MDNDRYYFVRIMALGLFLFFASIVFYFFAPQVLISDNLLFIAPFFFLVSILSRVINSRMVKNDSRKALLSYLISSSVRLFIYLLILIGYGLINREDAPAFFISFLLFYLLFTFVEVKLTLRESTQ